MPTPESEQTVANGATLAMVNSQTGSVDIFQDEWKACLRAHYFHVIYEHDWKNERSLARVLLQTGITQDEISTWRAEALHEIGMDEKIAELEPQVAKVEVPQLEISQSSELPDETQPEAVGLGVVADTSAEVPHEETEFAPAAEPGESAEASESAETIVQPQMLFGETVDELATADSDPEPPPSPPAEPPAPPPQQMSLF